MAELTLNKIFTDQLVKNSVTEYRQTKEKRSLLYFFKKTVNVEKLIIKGGYKFKGKTEEWVKLFDENVIADEIELGYGSYEHQG